jgi:hypothetical protein
MAFEILSILTNEAKHRMGLMLATGASFKITHFAVGAGGHDPLDPSTALTPNPADTDCPGTFFTDVIDSYYFAGDFCPVFVCNLEEGEAVGDVSSLCLIATTVYPVAGTQFLFSIATMPLKARTDMEKWVFEVGVQF